MRCSKWTISAWVMLPAGAISLALAHSDAGNLDGPTVWETEVHVPGDGLFVLTARATDLGTGFWRYEYALQNVNSIRAAGSFRICFFDRHVVENVGFHDVDYQSGEMYDGADWMTNLTDGGVTWSTQSYAANPNANALRSGTTYNFRLDANAPPYFLIDASIELFRPGEPTSVRLWTIGPSGEACANPSDTDHDGKPNCYDFCPDTPPGACLCEGEWCCLGCMGPCYPESPDTCAEIGGKTYCDDDPQCKNGCPLFDMDNDGDRDLADFARLQLCFSGLPGNPGFVAPTQECIKRLDVDDDHAIGLGDYKQLFDLGLLGR